MTPQQKKLLLPMIILALGFVSLVGVALYIISQPADHRAVANIGGPFQLVDQDGKRVSEATYKGGPSIVFFGFTHCPDVCPTALTRAQEVKQQLGKDGERLQVVFVSVDPERDTPALLGNYLAAFDSSFIGLRGDAEQTRQAAAEFKVFYEKVPTGSSYTINHTAMSYLFDAQGRLRLALRHTQPSEDYVADLRLLMRE
mgnify:CR=1 FL=1